NVSLPSLALEALKAHKVEQSKIRLLLGPDYRKDLDLVFPAWDGSPWSPDSVSHMFKRLAKKLGYHDITFHGLRHTHASHLLKQNVHMKIASERLGHSSINITMDLYSHLLDGMDDEAANKIDQALRAAMKKKD
ncbi:MAG: tyrosine-type recombinase/integrase, partial [Acidiferrobacterales bacterium]